MLALIKALLISWIETIDAGNSHLTEKQEKDVLSYLLTLILGDEEMSKTAACDYLHMCRSKFDTCVHDGLIPKGQKKFGFKQKYWYKSDLDKYNNSQH